jgi:aryl-alcohol dehydrogenase-like predicted oxidoreductase
MMQLDHYVTLGHSGLCVSPFCLGAMTFGEDTGIGSPPHVAQAILDAYIDRGGNFIDTANLYGNGHSEVIIGDHVGQYPSKRDRLVIATKFSGNAHYGDPNGGGASRKSMVKQCENSLRRLKTDYIDLYWMHFEDAFTPIEETMQALDELVRSGKVRYIGFSDTSAWKVARAQTVAEFRGWTTLIALQIEYSLLARTVEGELVPAALALGMGLTPWSPLKSGLLSGKYRRGAAPPNDTKRHGPFTTIDDRGYDVIDKLLAIAESRRSTPARVALAWLLTKPAVASPIIGARTTAQLEDNLAALELKLAQEDLTALNAVSEPQLNFPAPMLARVGGASRGDITVNGQHIPPSSCLRSALVTY